MTFLGGELVDNNWIILDTKSSKTIVYSSIQADIELTALKSDSLKCGF